MLEYIQTDIWVRFQKLRGNQAVYVCADDAHGSAIMLRAEKEGITPEQLIANVQAEHSADFADFLVAFDNFHSTHSDENRELAELIYTRLRTAGHIETETITQAYGAAGRAASMVSSTTRTSSVGRSRRRAERRAASARCGLLLRELIPRIPSKSGLNST